MCGSRESVPTIVDMGVCGAQLLGAPAGVGLMVHPGMIFEDQSRLVFCEGIARSQDGREFVWEVWTEDEWGRVGLADSSHAEPCDDSLLGIVDLHADRAGGAIVRQCGHYTAVIVAKRFFWPGVIERLQAGTETERRMVFTRVEADVA